MKYIRNLKKEIVLDGSIHGILENIQLVQATVFVSSYFIPGVRVGSVVWETLRHTLCCTNSIKWGQFTFLSGIKYA